MTPMGRTCQGCHDATAETSQMEYRRRHPERAAVGAAASRAIKMGVLVRPKKCEGCGEKGRPIYAHHPSYAQDRRLDVQWLCGSCHKTLHWSLLRAENLKKMVEGEL